MNLSNLLFFISTVSCRSGNRFISFLGVPVLPQNTEQAMDIVSWVEHRTDFMAILSIWTSEIQKVCFCQKFEMKWNSVQDVPRPVLWASRYSSLYLAQADWWFWRHNVFFPRKPATKTSFELHISIKLLNWDAFVYKTKGTVVPGLLLPGWHFEAVALIHQWDLV